MITIHRPDIMDKLVQIMFNKIKPRAIGTIGNIEFRFDVGRFTYFEQENPSPNIYTKNYASPKDEENKQETKLENQIKPNTAFENSVQHAKEKVEEEEADWLNKEHKEDLPF